jgi:GNAT superfamily N-acetyltransferase
MKAVPMEAWDLVEVGKLLDTPSEQGWLLDHLGEATLGAFVVRKGYKAKGAAWGTLKGDTCTLRMLVVHPSFRRKGHAASLMTALVTWARTLRPACVLSVTVPSKGSALALWHHAGFQAASVRLVWDKPGVPLAPSPSAVGSPGHDGGAPVSADTVERPARTG